MIPIGSFVANFFESAAKDLIVLIRLFRNAERRLRRIAGGGSDLSVLKAPVSME